MTNKIKIFIPNIITTFRLAGAFIFPVLFLNDKILLAFFIFIGASLSDALDGFLARKWEVVSEYGKKVDPIADKFLSGISLILITTRENSFLLAVLILEVLIVLITIISYARGNHLSVSAVGKVKTVFLFITISIALLNILNGNLYTILYITTILTILFQLISIKGYFSINKTLKLNNY